MQVYRKIFFVAVFRRPCRLWGTNEKGRSAPFHLKYAMEMSTAE